MTSLRAVMAKDPITIGPDATMAGAAAAMVAGRVGSLLVHDEDGAVVGILTERDVLRAAGSDGDLLATKVRDWMTREPTTAPADQSIEDAVATMLDGGFRHLPVTDGGDVIGIVSLRALFSAHVGSGSAQPGDIGSTGDSAPAASPTDVQHRRERLYEATRGLLEHGNAPAADAAAWRDELGAAVDVLADVVAEHVTETEGPGGFFEELVRETGGRLSAAVRRLGREHERSTELLEALRADIDAGADPDDLRQDADELFAQLEAHRHRGGDLLWQAYSTDIGGDG